MFTSLVTCPATQTNNAFQPPYQIICQNYGAESNGGGFALHDLPKMCQDVGWYGEAHHQSF